jgi:GTP-binding protein
MRASGSERAMKIAPAQKISLEEALEYIKDDELVEVTPKHVRMRKRFLTDNERKRMKRAIEGVES